MVSLVLIPALAACGAIPSSSDAPTPGGSVTSAPEPGGSVTSAPEPGGSVTSATNPGDPVTSATNPGDPVTSAPPTGEPDIPPDEGGDPPPSVSLPRLPVGGDSEFIDDTENLQCANVSWIVEAGGPGELRRGIQIKITDFKLDEQSFRYSREGCEDRGPTCVGYTITVDSDNPACVLAVLTNRPLLSTPDNTELRISGRIECPDVSASTCEDFVEAAEEGGSISLSAPSVDAPEEDPSSDPTGDPSGEQEPEEDGGQSGSETPNPDESSSDSTPENLPG